MKARFRSKESGFRAFSLQPLFLMQPLKKQPRPAKLNVPP
jgi:hypothetical protein